MTPRSLSVSRSALGLLLLGRLLVGCFDVQQVDVPTTQAEPMSLVIDDFDDGDRQPALDSLGLWSCGGANGNVQNVRAEPGQGLHSTMGRVVTFDLVDVPDTFRDYQAVELRTATLVPLDLTAHERFVFSAALDADATPSSMPVRVRFYCGDDLDDGVLESPDQSVPAAAPFRAYSSPIAKIRQPVWQKEDWAMAQRPVLDELSCLAGIRALSIYVQPEMPDGQRAAGKLALDDIHVQ